MRKKMELKNIEHSKPKAGEFYKHFKNKLYQILTIAIHTETGEEMVVYQALYDDFKVYVRPMELFLSEVDHEKYPDSIQKYRFEKYEFKDERQLETNIVNKESIFLEEEKALEEAKKKELEEQIQQTKIETKKLGLMDFLEADTCQEKLNVLNGLERSINETMIDNIAISLDLAITEGSIESRVEEIRDYLLTRIRFESNRGR